MQESSNTHSSTPNPTNMMVTAVLAHSSEIRLATAGHRINHQFLHAFLDYWPKAWADRLWHFPPLLRWYGPKEEAKMGTRI
jgi:hypothetical protein